jgi:hypothetical protein
MTYGSPSARQAERDSLPELVPGLYKHFKGRYYLVLGLAHSADSDLLYVVYIPLYPHEGAPMAIREVNDFLSTVQPDKGSEGSEVPVPRFEYCGQALPGVADAR